MRVFVSIVILLICAVQLSAAPAQPSDRAYEFAKSFRVTEPFLIQTIVVSAPEFSGNRIFLLTEPPQHAFKSRDKWIQRVFGANLLSTAVVEHQIGYDGFVRDVIVEAKPMDSAQISKVISEIDITYYGKAYKAHYLLFAPKSWDADRELTRRRGPPDAEVSASSIQEWLYGDDSLKFSSDVLDSDNPVAEDVSADELKTDQFGVYYSRPAGLVVFMIPRRQSLNNAIPMIRRFFVDTDGVAGAVTAKGSDWLLLIGRERTTPIEDMEPLRVDTFLTLASNKQQNLAQSYQRRAPLAGKVISSALMSALSGIDSHQLLAIMRSISAPLVSNKSAEDDSALVVSEPYPLALGLASAVDWAPILLSRELTHTEFGQLLNITDQMLKSWSSANSIEYVRFPYPMPYGNPDARGLSYRIARDIGEVESLTFNWNTAGLGTWTEIGGRQIFTLLRSGALPVTYIPESESLSLDPEDVEVMQQAEDDYWNFFANLRDPYLNRAAQYTALHLIFSTVPVTASRSERLVDEKAYLARWNAFEGQVATALRSMAAHMIAGSHPYASVVAESEGVAVFNETSGCIVYRKHVEQLLSGEEEGIRATLVEFSRLDDLAAILNDNERIEVDISKAIKDYEDKEKNLRLMVSGFNDDVDRCNIMPSATDCGSVLEGRRSKLEAMQDSLGAEASALERRIISVADARARSKLIVDHLSAFGDCSLASKSVVDGVPSSDDSVFHTPGVVVSRDGASLGRTGGHNLDGRSVEVIGDAAVAPGKVVIDAESGVLRLNPNDVPNGANAARAFERDFRRYIAGDANFQKVVLQRVEAALVHDIRAVQDFDALMLSRPGDAVAGSRGLVAPPASNGSRVLNSAPQVVRLDDSAAAELRTLAQNSEGQVVIRSLEGGPMEVALPGGRPPLAVRVGTRADLQAAVEAMVTRAGAPPSTATTIRLVSADSTLSVGDLIAIKLSAAGRPSAGMRPLTAAGAGGGRLPPGGTGGLLFDGAGGPWHKRLMVSFFSQRGNPLKRLQSRDADWARATVHSVDIGGATGKSLTAALDIPSKTVDRPNIFARVSALFARRNATDADRVAFMAAVEKVGNEQQNVELWRQLEMIRIEFLNNVVDGGDANLQWQIRDTADDFYVVERESGADLRSRQNG